MILSSKSDSFRFLFPKDFIPTEIETKYASYINRINTPLSTANDVINYSIQGISFASVGLTPVRQMRRASKEVDYRSVEPLFQSRQLTISLSLLDGFLNYWMMLDILAYYYENPVDKTHIPQFRLQMLDSEGNVLTSIFFKEVLFIGLSDLELSYSSNIQQFSTFDVTFNYNILEIDLEFDKNIPPYKTSTTMDQISSTV
jgi:hypothetical protein